MVYSRKIDNSTLTFGISGRLYRSNVLFYDHQSQSLWSQLLGKAISGPMVGKPLRTLPSNRVKWKSWRKRHPNTLVLSEQTGYARDYARDPYAGYYRIGSLMFPVGKVRKDLPSKKRVLGITVAGISRAYPLEELVQNAGTLADRVGNMVISIEVSNEGEVTAVTDSSGKPLPHVFSYWFAWQAFHPNTTVYRTHSNKKPK